MGGHKNKPDKSDKSDIVITLQKDELQSLIEESVNKAVKNAIEECKAELADLCKTLCEKLDSRIFDLEQENDKLRGLQESTSKTLQSMKIDLDNATRNINHNEQYSRRNSLNLQGCPQEFAKSKDPKKTVADILSSKLGESVKREDLDATHPIGKSQNGHSTFIVKFHSRELRDKLMAKRRLLKRSPKMQKNTPILVMQDNLTRQNVQLLKEVKQHKSVKSAWSWQGTIWALTAKDKKVKCDILMDLDKLFQ